MSSRNSALNAYNLNNEKTKKTPKKQKIKKDKIEKQIKFATLNANHLSGKVHLLEKCILRTGLDFMYVTEAGIAPGSYPLTENVVFQVGHERKEGAGRYPYGHVLLRNPSSTTNDHFIPIITTDPFLLAFKFRGRVFCGIYIKPLDTTMTTQMLEKMSGLLRLHQEIIFFGDFNARHMSFGDHASNQQGKSLLSWMQDNGLQRAAPTSGEIFTFSTNRGRSIPDHVIHSQGIEVATAVDTESFVGDSDHRPLIGRTPRVSEERYNRNIFRGWNLRRLEEEETKAKVTEFLGDRESSILSVINDIAGDTDIDCQTRVNQINQAVTRVLTDCLEQIVGKTVKKFKRRPFLSEELSDKEKRCQYMYEAWKTATNGDARDSLWAEYMQSRKTLAKAIKRAKVERFQEFCSVTDRQDTSVMIKTLNAISKAKKRRLPVGLSNFPEKFNEYADHFQAIYNNDLPVIPNTFGWTAHITNESPCDLTVSVADVLAALKEVPKGKAVGIDNIPNEILKVAPFPTANMLAAAFDVYARLRTVPHLWTVSVIKPVIKKGDPSAIANYRPISLSVTMRRLFEKIMLPRITRIIEPLHKSQNGFRSSRECLTAIKV